MWVRSSVFAWLCMAAASLVLGFVVHLVQPVIHPPAAPCERILRVGLDRWLYKSC